MRLGQQPAEIRLIAGVTNVITRLSGQTPGREPVYRVQPPALFCGNARRKPGAFGTRADRPLHIRVAQQREAGAQSESFWITAYHLHPEGMEGIETNKLKSAWSDPPYPLLHFLGCLVAEGEHLDVFAARDMVQYQQRPAHDDGRFARSCTSHHKTRLIKTEINSCLLLRIKSHGKSPAL